MRKIAYQDGEDNKSSKKLPSILKTLYGLYKEFCHQTTLHGLKHTVADELHCTERILWLLLTIAAFSGAVYCGLNQFNRYNSEPVVVSMQRGYRGWWSTFPAVTACFLDRVQPDKAAELIYSIWNVTEESDQEMYQYYYSFIELVADVSFRTNLQNFWKYTDDATVAGVDLVQLASDVHPTLSLRVIVSKADKEVQWVPVMTEMGVCMTFNSAFAKFQNLLQDVDWTMEELLKCHYHSGQCFVRIDSVQNAVRYFIHSPYDIPSAISNPTGEVMPAEELVMEFKLLEIQGSQGLRNLRSEQRKCRFSDEMISEEIESYSFSLCQMQCRTKMAIMFCGCRPYFYVKGDGVVCDAHGMACIGRNVEILVNLPGNLAKCSCLPQCAELNYFSHTKTIISQNSSQDSETDSVASVKFNLMPPKFRLHRDVIFTIEDLFASLGGTTALFVGASVLTVIESLLFILRNIVIVIYAYFNLRRFKNDKLLRCLKLK